MQLLFKSTKRILERFEHYKVCAKDWFIARSQGAHAKGWLALLSFTEGSFSMIPPEALLIPILIVNGARWVHYVLITIVSSLLGGIFAFFIGAFLFESLGEFIITTYALESELLYISELFNKNAFWTIFIAAFTPLPYKIFAISSGFFSINFFIFVGASLLGRSLRYFALGYVMARYGSRIGRVLFKYFNVISAFIIVMLAIIFFIKIF